MMMAGSFHGTRTTGTVSVWEIACSIGQRSLKSVSPCCMSTQSASKPWRAMTSAVKPLGTESQPRDTHLFSRHICLIRFGRIIAPRVVGVSGEPGKRPQRSTSSGAAQRRQLRGAAQRRAARPG